MSNEKIEQLLIDLSGQTFISHEDFKKWLRARIEGLLKEVKEELGRTK